MLPCGSAACGVCITADGAVRPVRPWDASTTASAVQGPPTQEVAAACGHSPAPTDRQEEESATAAPPTIHASTTASSAAVT